MHARATDEGMTHATIIFESSPYAPNAPILLPTGRTLRIGRIAAGDIIGVAHESNRAVAKRHLVLEATMSPSSTDLIATVHNTTTSQPVVIEIDGHAPVVLAAKERWTLARSARIVFGRRRSRSQGIAECALQVQLPNGYERSRFAVSTASSDQHHTINASISRVLTEVQFPNVVAHCAPLLEGSSVAATDAEVAVLLGQSARQAQNVGQVWRRAIKNIVERCHHVALPPHAIVAMTRTEICTALIECGAVTRADLDVLVAA